MEQRKYTEHELQQKIERAKKSIEFRVEIDKRLDKLEDAIEKLLSLRVACQKEWRSDILWFCGVPTGCIGLIIGFIKLLT